MVYRRKPIYTKVYNKNTKTWSKINKLRKDVSQLKRSEETKYHDENVARSNNSYAINDTQILCDPVQSLTAQTRIGDSISPYRIEINGALEWIDPSGPVIQRVMLIQSKQKFIPSTTASAGSVQSVLTLGGTIGAPFSTFDWNNRSKFTVLYDRTFGLDFQRPQVTYKIRKKISRNIKFEDTGSLTAESGQLYLLHFSNNSAIPPKKTFYSRVYYKDS